MPGATDGPASPLCLPLRCNGKVGIFQKDGRGGEAFIGEDWGAFTPIDDEMKLYLGLARDVVVRRKVLSNRTAPLALTTNSRDSLTQ